MEHFTEAGFEPNIYTKCTFDLMIAYDFVALDKGVFIFVNTLANISGYDELSCIPINVPTAIWDIGFIIKKDIKVNQTMKVFMNYFLNKNGQNVII